MAQAGQLGLKVSSHLALLYIYGMNQANSCNDSESRWQHHKHCPGIIIIIIMILSAGY